MSRPKSAKLPLAAQRSTIAWVPDPCTRVQAAGTTDIRVETHLVWPAARLLFATPMRTRARIFDGAERSHDRHVLFRGGRFVSDVEIPFAPGINIRESIHMRDAGRIRVVRGRRGDEAVLTFSDAAIWRRCAGKPG